MAKDLSLCRCGGEPEMFAGRTEAGPFMGIRCPLCRSRLTGDVRFREGLIETWNHANGAAAVPPTRGHGRY